MRAMIYAAAAMGAMTISAAASEQSEALQGVAVRCLNPVVGADEKTAEIAVEVDANGQATSVLLQNRDAFGNLGNTVSLAIERAFNRCSPYNVDAGHYDLRIPVNG